ncbi:MAG: LutC/YkgG family protein [Alphaproteobacteria bacterium]
MTGARDAILGAIRGSLGRDKPIADAARDALDERIASHPRNIVPARADLPTAARLDLFQQYAEKAAATVTRVADMAAVPQAVSDYLRRENLPSRFVMAPDPTLDAAPWADLPMLEHRRGKPEPSDEVGVSSMFAAVAETGSLVALSGPDHPSTLNFLPETHIVVLPADRVTGSYEDVWDRLRQHQTDGTLPRTVNMITGPSLSGDIEQTLLHGAHGPRRLHIFLVGDGTA